MAEARTRPARGLIDTAHASGLRRFTRNADDLRGLEEFLEIVAV